MAESFPEQSGRRWQEQLSHGVRGNSCKDCRLNPGP